jgi:hypothetical protein
MAREDRDEFGVEIEVMIEPPAFFLRSSGEA